MREGMLVHVSVIVACLRTPSCPPPPPGPAVMARSMHGCLVYSHEHAMHLQGGPKTRPKPESPPEPAPLLPLTPAQRAADYCEKIRKQASACRWFAINLETHQFKEIISQCNAHAVWLEAMYRCLSKLITRKIEDAEAYNGHFRLIDEKFEWFSKIERTLRQMEKDTLPATSAGKKGKGAALAAAV